jgi:ABC-2 type transport system permease protein
MKTIFRFALSRSRGQILGWGITMALLAWIVVWFYDPFKEQQQQWIDLLNTFPKEIMGLFGDLNGMFSTKGYLDLQFFIFLPLLLGIFAVLAGSGLLVSDEENGTLDLILAHPISRTALLAGRGLAFVVSTLVILVISWLGLVLPLGASSLALMPGAAALPFVSLFGVVLLFGSLALLLSMLLPSRKLAASLAGLLLVVSFFVSSLANFIHDLKAAAQFSPISYYQSANAIDGLNAGWLIGLLVASSLFTGVAWWLFQKRDIRVSGEGSWRLPLRRQKRATHLESAPHVL